uniref:NBS-LRR disease resistance protein family-3 n=1 Tax=Oryza coarctata TaxID=77588 RepID=E0CWA7_ORYCO|nr:NBS-LRR disease resistance protein family-3 [Oryza coarctata]
MALTSCVAHATTEGRSWRSAGARASATPPRWGETGVPPVAEPDLHGSELAHRPRHPRTPEAIGGMIASAVIKETTQRLGFAIGGEIKLQWNFRRDLEGLKEDLESIEAVLEGLKEDLESIEAVLEDAESRSIKDKTVQLWLKRLKDTTRELSEMLEEFKDETTEPAARKSSVNIFCLPRIKPKVTMAHKMKEMRLKLKNITDIYHNFAFKQGSSSAEQQVLDKRETSSMEYEGFVVGRTEKKNFMLSCLSDNMKNTITMLPIYGIGGIGKTTTFAKIIFNDIQFNDYSKQKVDFEARPDKDRLKQVGREIALKCGGVALAAQALGYMLRSLTVNKWNTVKSSDIWNEFQFGR